MGWLTSTVDSIIFCGYLLSRIEEQLSFLEYLIHGFGSGYKPIENLIFFEHWNSCFICTHGIHINWYPSNNDESIVCTGLFCFMHDTTEKKVKLFLKFSPCDNTAYNFW